MKNGVRITLASNDFNKCTPRRPMTQGKAEAAEHKAGRGPYMTSSEKRTPFYISTFLAIGFAVAGLSYCSDAAESDQQDLPPSSSITQPTQP